MKGFGMRSNAGRVGLTFCPLCSGMAINLLPHKQLLRGGVIALKPKILNPRNGLLPREAALHSQYPRSYFGGRGGVCLTVSLKGNKVG